MAMYGLRAGFKPIEPASDEMMGIRNIQASSGGSIYAPEQYYTTQASISGLGDAYSDRAAHFTRNVAADAHSGMGNTDEQSNARFQELAQRESELKDKILNLEAEIQWQEKLRDNEMSGDPMWEVAKHKFIYDNDTSALESIMNRKHNEKIAAEARKQEQYSKLRADRADLETKIGYLGIDLDEYESAMKKAEKSKSEADITAQMNAKRALARTYFELNRNLKAQGMKLEDVLSTEDYERLKKYIDISKFEEKKLGEKGSSTPKQIFVESTGEDVAKQRKDLTEKIQALRNQHKYDEAQKLLESGVSYFNSGDSDPEYTSIQNDIAEEKRKWDAGAKAREAASQLKKANKDTELIGWFYPSTATKSEANTDLNKFRKRYPNLIFKLKAEENGNWGVTVEVPK